jgi:hypothetical protein
MNFYSSHKSIAPLGPFRQTSDKILLIIASCSETNREPPTDTGSVDTV